MGPLAFLAPLLAASSALMTAMIVLALLPAITVAPQLLLRPFLMSPPGRGVWRAPALWLALVYAAAALPILALAAVFRVPPENEAVVPVLALIPATMWGLCTLPVTLLRFVWRLLLFVFKGEWSVATARLERTLGTFGLAAAGTMLLGLPWSTVQGAAGLCGLAAMIALVSWLMRRTVADDAFADGTSAWNRLVWLVSKLALAVTVPAMLLIASVNVSSFKAHGEVTANSMEKTIAFGLVGLVLLFLWWRYRGALKPVA